MSRNNRVRDAFGIFMSLCTTLLLMLNLVRTLLTLRRLLPAQLRLDEHVDLPVHHFLDVARLRAGAVVFHHLIRLENVRANLVAPRYLAFLAVLPVDLGALLVLLDLI